MEVALARRKARDWEARGDFSRNLGRWRDNDEIIPRLHQETLLGATSLSPCTGSVTGLLLVVLLLLGPFYR